jgi:Tol biopolymer transport system component
MRSASLRSGTWSLVAAAALLTACGGGGGGGGSSSRFPAGVVGQDLVAVEYEVVTTRDPRVRIVDSGGSGEYDVEGIFNGEFGSIEEMRWSPNHSRLAVLAYPNGTGEVELFVVEALTGVVHNVAGPSTANDYVDTFEWSPNSLHLAYQRSLSVGHSPIFTVDVDGTNRDEVSGAVVAGGAVSGFGWSPDSTRLALSMSADDVNIEEVYVVSRDGSARSKVSGPAFAGSSVSDVRWSPDGTRVAYLGDLATDGVSELWSSPAAGPASSIRHHPVLTGGRDVVRFEWAPDGSRIAFVADTADEVFQLFTSLPDGTGFTTVSGSAAAGADVEQRFFWAPNSSRIAFRADRLTDGVVELFTTTPDGLTVPVRVSGPMVAGGDLVDGGDTIWSPDSTRLLYNADQDLNDSFHVYVTSAAAATSIRLSPAPAADDGTRDLRWSPDSSLVRFNFNPGTPGLSGGSYLAPVAGPAVLITASDPGSFGGNGPFFTLDGSRLVSVYRTDSGVEDVRAFAVPSLLETILSTPPAHPNSVDLEN